MAFMGGNGGKERTSMSADVQALKRTQRYRRQYHRKNKLINYSRSSCLKVLKTLYTDVASSRILGIQKMLSAANTPNYITTLYVLISSFFAIKMNK